MQNTLRTTRVAIMAAVTMVSAQISLPLPFSPVPLVLSNMAAVIAGILLGPRDGVICMLVYLALGTAGLPVFAGFHGGLGVLVGPTGGYLIGFVLGAWTAGMIFRAATRNESSIRWGAFWAAVFGLIVIYFPGLFWLHYVLHLDPWKTLILGFFPFVVGDALKSLAIALVSPRIIHAMSQRSGASG